MTLNPDHPTEQGGGPRDAAQQEAGRLGSEAQSAARDVAGTAQEEAVHLKDETMTQVKDLADSAKQEASSQLSTQKDRLAAQSRTVSDDLERISRGEKPESDLVNQAVSKLSERARHLTEQLESKEPMDLLDDVRRFAARRPGTFLAIAAGVGLVAGRLTRGVKDAHDDGQHGQHGQHGGQYGDRTNRPPLPGRPATGPARDIPLPPAEPPVVVGPDLSRGAPASEGLATPAVNDPYGTGRPPSGGRP
ncbi:hypothetical protein [Citricoccus muralis]|uniref:Uncharacterized protein n=1 Tax=Citricoccus muralis TaxID=169134 RepID=A0A3D9LBK3_9MICC|nr:hypothetical protein [Citricoccus muralis]REE03759.1 hypothetical protein C8E99_1577 [Citricoccus muralis]